MSSLSVLFAACFLFACVAYTHSEPIPTAELVQNQRYELKNQEFALDPTIPTEMPIEPSTPSNPPANNILDLIKRVVFFIPRALVNGLRVIVNTITSLLSKGGNTISDILLKLINLMA